MRIMLRQYLIFLLLLISAQTFSQDNKSSLDWKDTTFTSVTLSDTKGGKKIVTLEVGNKATIYLKLNLLRQSATEMKNDFNGKELTKIIYILDSSSKVSDTVLIENHLLYLDYLVSLQLQGGNGLVYYKK